MCAQCMNGCLHKYTFGYCQHRFITHNIVHKIYTYSTTPSSLVFWFLLDGTVYIPMQVALPLLEFGLPEQAM